MSINFNKNTGNEIRSSAHSKYRCQYHIVFAPKYRRKEIYGQLRKDIGEILRKLCAQKGVEIIEAEACPDHIHMLISIPPHISVAQFMGYLKGKSTLMIFDRHANLKYSIWFSAFSCSVTPFCFASDRMISSMRFCAASSISAQYCLTYTQL